MDGDERARADEDDEAEWDEARRPPLDAYSWVIFFLLAAIVACLVLLSYAVITLRADQARGPTPVPPEDVGNVVLEAEGGPGPFTPVDLAVWAGRPLLTRQPFDATEIDEVILGCVNPLHDEVNPGRVAALRLGCGAATPGWTVQRNCASGMQSIVNACERIRDGRADLVLAGGTEALSRTPLVLPTETAAWLGDWERASVGERAKLLTEVRPHLLRPIVSLLHGLTDPNCGLNMGQTAEILAHRFDIRREDADAYALESHRRLAREHANCPSGNKDRKMTTYRVLSASVRNRLPLSRVSSLSGPEGRSGA